LSREVRECHALSVADSLIHLPQWGEAVSFTTLEGPAQRVALSPNGPRVAVASGAADSLVRVFDAPSGREVLTCDDPKGPVPSLALQGDNRTPVSASGDKTGRLSDLGVLAIRASLGWEWTRPSLTSLSLAWMTTRRNAPRTRRDWQDVWGNR
jgi:WD40 repeat protein